MKTTKAIKDEKIILEWVCPYCEEENETDDEQYAYDFGEISCWNCHKVTKVKL